MLRNLAKIFERIEHLRALADVSKTMSVRPGSIVRTVAFARAAIIRSTSLFGSKIALYASFSVKLT